MASRIKRAYCVVLVALFTTAGCPSLPRVPPQVIDEYDKLVSTSSEDSTSQHDYTVWFGTTREPINDPSEGSLRGYSGVDDGELHYGQAIVHVPESHEFGEIGSSWVRRLVKRSDDRLKLKLLNRLSGEDFQTLIELDVSQRETGKRTALIYIHGYSTDFEDSVIRAAQIGYDLKVEGITALFSWPSKGLNYAYTVDEATIEAAEPFFETFLRNVAMNPAIEEVNVVAHSMGNRLLLRSVERLANDPTFPKKAINQIILAAPDVDTRIFTQLASHYAEIAERTTLYVSREDLALRSSGIVHGEARVGFAPPITIIPGIDTISVSNIDLTVLGHSYFGEAEAVLYDIHHLLRFGTEPDDRIRLSRAPGTDGRSYYWEIEK